MARFGVTIHAFDPTPKAVNWVSAQDFPATFKFHPVGIADYDGTATFNAPARIQDASYTIVKGRGNAAVAVEADVRRLSTIMSQLGHYHIDLLKIDIEGAEYGVVKDLIATRLDIRQLLLEFHHSFETIGVEETNEAVALLRAHGFALFYVSPRGEEYSFVQT
jgi:FkbM family methyltransferase